MLLERISQVPVASLSQATKPTNQYYGLLCEVKEKTKFLDESYPDKKITLALRIFCIENNITETQRCKECGEITSLSADVGLFNDYCCKECRTKNNNKLPDDVIEKLSNYHWMYDQRITNRMSKEDIAAALNISITPVNFWLKKHDLNKQKYNEANPFTKAKLRDKDWLFQEHVTNHRTCEDIANEIGSTKSSVSLALGKHGIVTNPANSYDREPTYVSKPEIEIGEYVGSLGVEYKHSNRSILRDGEIDIIIPSHNFGIEHNGLYAHCYKPEESAYCRRKDRSYHRGKYLKAKNKGIHLMQFWGSQWIHQKDIVKSIISNKLGFAGKRYARKCVIVDVPNGIKNKFLDENHLQGADRSSIRYGLEFDGNLVALMTFNKTRYSKEYTWELSRFCCLKFHSVVGAFSKLLKHFRKTHEGSIVSYSDCMWSNGNVYEKNGFTCVRENGAGYHYVSKNCDKLIHRNNFRKSKIAVDGDTRTEEEIMFEKGYKKIFDAGNAVWVLT